MSELSLNLEATDNNKVREIINNLKLHNVDQEKAFILIKQELGVDENYKDAELQFRIGKRVRTIKWNEFEGLLENYDITQKMSIAQEKTKNFKYALSIVSDEYYNSIKESEVVRNGV